MKVSLNSFAFGPVGGWVPSYLVEEAIRRTAKIGYSGIERAAIRPHLWPYDLAAYSVSKGGVEAALVFRPPAMPWDPKTPWQ